MTGLSGSENFITIPFDARLEIVKLLNVKEKQTLRQTCSFLALEVDEYFGPSNCLHLHDGKSPEVLEFIGRTMFRTIKIPKRCFLDFDTVIHSPLKIQSISLTNRGIITSEFASQIFSSCTNLKTMYWTGTINGIIPFQGSPFILQKLESVKIDSSPTEYYFLQSINGLKPYSKESVESAWHNQLAILQRLHLPTCNDVKLHLRTFQNQAHEFYDEIYLAARIITFLVNNPKIEKFEAILDNWKYTSRFHQERSFLSKEQNVENNTEPDMDVEMLVLKDHTFYIKELNFDVIVSDNNPAGQFLFTERPGINISLCLTKFLKRNKFEGLKKLHLLIKTLRVEWSKLEKILERNGKSLEHLDISARFEGLINFEVLSQSPNLKQISLYNFGIDYLDEDILINPSPLAQNFGPYPNMIENLEVLKLRNITLSEQDVISLGKLRSLKEVSFKQWFGEDPFVPVINIRVLVQSLYLHRTLDSIELRMPYMEVLEIEDSELDILDIMLN